MNHSSKAVSLRPILIAAACGVLYGINIGLGSNCKGIFFSAIAEEFGVKLSTVTQYLTFYGITAALCIPFCTRFFLRFPARISLSCCVILYAGTTYLQGNVWNIPALYLLGALKGIPGGFITTYPMQHIIGNWFPKRKGSILGIVVMAAGAVGMLFNPIIQRWIDLYGWRTANHTVGILMLTTGLIAAAALNKAPANLRDEARQKSKDPEKKSVSADKISFRAFALYIGFALLIDLYLCFSQILPSFALSIQKSADFGAFLVSAAMLGNICFKLLLGMLNDILGTERTTIAALIPMALAGLIMAITRMEAFLLIAAFLSGTISATYAILFPLLLRKLCPPHQFTKLFSYTSALNSFAGAFSATALSLVYTLTGSFIPAMWFDFIAMLGCAGACLYIQRKRRFSQDKRTAITR